MKKSQACRAESPSASRPERPWPIAPAAGAFKGIAAAFAVVNPRAEQAHLGIGPKTIPGGLFDRAALLSTQAHRTLVPMVDIMPEVP